DPQPGPLPVLRDPRRGTNAIRGLESGCLARGGLLPRDRLTAGIVNEDVVPASPPPDAPARERARRLRWVGGPMHRALVKLVWLSNKAALRRALRGARTVRGALLILFTLGFVALMIVPQVSSAWFMRGRPEIQQQFADTMEPLVPVMLLGFSLMFAFTSAGE